MKRHTMTANKGETFTRSLRYLNPDGTPVDLSSYTSTLTLRDKNNVVTHTYVNQTTADGYVVVKVQDEITATWPSVSAYVIAIEQNSDVTWLLAGTLNASGAA